MVNNFLNLVEMKECTESGIQLATMKLIKPTESTSTANNGIIIPTSSMDLINAISELQNKKSLHY